MSSTQNTKPAAKTSKAGTRAWAMMNPNFIRSMSPAARRFAGIPANWADQLARPWAY